MKKKIVSIIGSVIAVAVSVVPAFAHVVVKPNTAGVASFQTFTVGVPNEKESPTIGIRLVIPDGVTHVSPNVKPGWTITEKKSGDGEDAKVTEIDWTGGVIPVGQRDEFLFSAQVPAAETTIAWKAYQTYQDGDVVAWDHDPKESDKNTTPYSTTQVINDLSSTQTSEGTQSHEVQESKQWQGLTMVALVLSVLAIGMQLRKKV